MMRLPRLMRRICSFKRLSTLVLVMALTGCATALSDLPCPPLKNYTEDELKQATDELTEHKKIWPECILCIQNDDYLSMRDSCR